MKAMKRGEKLIPAKKAPTMRGEKFIPAKKAMKTAGKLTPAKLGKPTAQAIVIDMSKKKSKT